MKNSQRIDSVRTWSFVRHPAVRVVVPAAWLLLSAFPGSFAQQPCDPAKCSADDLAVFAAKPDRYFFDRKFKEILNCAPCVLNGNYPESSKRDAVSTLALVHLQSGMAPVARAACLQLLTTNPCTAVDPALPRPLRALFYSAQDSLLNVTGILCETDFSTIAVGDIENNSQNALDLDMDKFCRGLQKIVMNDLAGATCLRVVDRDRIKTLADERNIAPAEAARIMGAKTYLFGSLLQVGKKDFILTIRLDRTETTEVLLSEQLSLELESGADLVKLEKKLLLEVMVPKITAMCQATDAKALKKRVETWFSEREGAVPDYLSYVVKVGDAVQADEEQDAKRSRDAWAEVAALNPFDRDAAQRRDMLESFAMGENGK